jgi:hypothetical protein
MSALLGDTTRLPDRRLPAAVVDQDVTLQVTVDDDEGQLRRRQIGVLARYGHPIARARDGASPKG